MNLYKLITEHYNINTENDPSGKFSVLVDNSRVGGWIPQGGVSIHHEPCVNGVVVFSQAMVRSPKTKRIFMKLAAIFFAIILLSTLLYNEVFASTGIDLSRLQEYFKTADSGINLLLLLCGAVAGLAPVIPWLIKLKTGIKTAEKVSEDFAKLIVGSPYVDTQKFVSEAIFEKKHEVAAKVVFNEGAKSIG